MLYSRSLRDSNHFVIMLYQSHSHIFCVTVIVSTFPFQMFKVQFAFIPLYIF